LKKWIFGLPMAWSSHYPPARLVDFLPHHPAAPATYMQLVCRIAQNIAQN